MLREMDILKGSKESDKLPSTTPTLLLNTPLKVSSHPLPKTYDIPNMFLIRSPENISPPL